MKQQAHNGNTAEYLGALETFVDGLGTASKLVDRDKALLVALQAAAQLADCFDDIRADDLGGVFREATKAVVEREALRVKLSQFSGQEAVLGALRSELTSAAQSFAVIDPGEDAQSKAEPCAASLASLINFLVDGFGSDVKHTMTPPLDFVYSALLDTRDGKRHPLWNRTPEPDVRKGGVGSGTAAIEIQAHAAGAVQLLTREMREYKAIKEVVVLFHGVPARIDNRTGLPTGVLTESALKNWTARASSPTTDNDRKLAKLAKLTADTLASKIELGGSANGVVKAFARGLRTPGRNRNRR